MKVSWNIRCEDVRVEGTVIHLVQTNSDFIHVCEAVLLSGALMYHMAL